MLESNISVGVNVKDLGVTFDEVYLNRPSVYLGVASGSSMEGVGIYSSDILIIDRAAVVKQMDVIVVFLNNCFYCKMADLKNNMLVSASDDYPPVRISEYDNYCIEGSVIASIRQHKPFNFSGLVSGRGSK